MKKEERYKVRKKVQKKVRKKVCGKKEERYKGEDIMTETWVIGQGSVIRARMGKKGKDGSY